MSHEKPSPYSIALADVAAIGHISIGLQLYKSFEALGKEKKLEFNRAMELGVPATTNLTLGLELLMKVLHFQISGSYPTGHDVSVLGSKYPDDVLDELRKEYKALYDNPSVSKGVEFRFTGGAKGHKAKEWTVPDTSTFDLAIEYIGPMYVKWRYIYEDFKEEIEIGVSFAPIYFAAMAVHKVIRGRDGDARITLTENEPGA